ncbi:MAG: ABC transporter ATP-binding protein [Bacteroidia bacterium]|nr:ABC transporter ATP-binding protein [Bacteroidia bacterium]
MIEIKDLNFEFSGGFRLSVDKLTIEKGQIFAIIGPNGAGKTTLLNIIALFKEIKSGSLRISGEDVHKTKNKLSLRRKMSFVFSQPYLLNDTVYNNVSLPLRLRGIRDGAYVNEMLKVFKITHLRNNNANILSQGEKHRVSLARAFVSQPRLVLLDEPFLSLDERFKESLINDLCKIIKLNRITAIFVTQDQFEALSLVDSMAVMINGKILQQATPPGDIFTKPSSREVADFVGVETILEGSIYKKEDNLCFTKVKDKVLETVSEYNEGDNVFVCIRPEDVIISKRTDISSARNHFKAKIIKIEPWRLGYKLLLDCSFNLVASVTAQSIKNLDLKIGQEIVASFKATAVHLIRRGFQDDAI